jgi:hypothetical protein
MTIEEKKKYMQGKLLIQGNRKDIKYFSQDDKEAIRFYIVQKLNSMSEDPEQLFDTINSDLFKGVQDFLIYENASRPERTTGVKIYDSNCVGAVVGCLFENHILKNRLVPFKGKNGWVTFQKNNDENVYDVDVKLTNTNLLLDIKTKFVPLKVEGIRISGTVGLAKYQFLMYAKKVLKGKVEDVWILSRYYYSKDYNGIVCMSIKKMLEYIDISDGQVKLKDNLGDSLQYTKDSKYNKLVMTDKMIYYNETLSDIATIDEFYSYLMDNY